MHYKGKTMQYSLYYTFVIKGGGEGLHLYRMLCVKFSWNWPSGAGEEDINFHKSVFCLFCNYLPLDKGTALHLNKLESPLPKDALCQVSLKLALWIWRWIFLNFINVYFCNFVIISPWIRTRPFIWTNLNPLYPRMPWAKFGWNWHFVYLDESVALHLTKLNFPSPKDAFCQVWLKLAQWFWRRRFF